MRAIVAVVAALALTAAAAAAVAKTKIQVYDPFAGGKLAPGLTLTKALRGSCVAGSSATPRAGAWRCFSGNAVLDPCFAKAGVKWLACPVTTPFDKRVARLNLTKPLPAALANKARPGVGHPWTIRLTNGTVCAFLTGATIAFHGERVNYGCDRRTFLAGVPDRTTPTWTITLGTGPRAKPQRAQIAVAIW